MLHNKVYPNLFSLSLPYSDKPRISTTANEPQVISYFVENNFFTMQAQMQMPNVERMPLLSCLLTRHEAFKQCLLSAWKNRLLRQNLGMHGPQCH